MDAVVTKERKRTQHQNKPPQRRQMVDKVAYIMSRFPKLTETFILYEMVALEKAGVQVELFPLLKEEQDVHHAEVARYMKKAHFHPFISLPIILANLSFFLRKPITYIKMILDIMTSTFGSRKFFIGAIGIIPKSVRFAYEMEKLGVKHVHCHFCNHPAVAGFIITRLTGIPFTFTAHGSDLHVERRMLDKKIEASATAVTVSNFNKEVMVTECGEEMRDKIEVIHCGVDPNLFKDRVKEETDEPFQIVCVASYEEVKGHKYLVKACEVLSQRGIDYTCHFIGYGPLRQEVEKQIADAGLSDNFKIYGGLPRTEVLKMYEIADTFVLPSVPTSNGKKEGVPVVLMEAMSSCVPVISSQISGIPELVKDGHSGLLTEPRDVNGLADALQKLHDNPALRRKLGKAGRRFVQEEFNLEENTQKLFDLFTDVRNGKSPS